MRITITPEYWAQPGSIKYAYRHTMEKTLWNVDKIEGRNVILWTINAWGQTQYKTHQKEFFSRDFTEHGKPSMYESMRGAIGAKA